LIYDKVKMSSNPLISVCIPSYNRPEYIGDLITTILEQKFDDYELIVSEDNSPKTKDVEAVVESLAKKYPTKKVRFIRHHETLGYDGNFRSLIEASNGEFCVFMGDDDLLCDGALNKIATIIKNNKGLGVILRSWARADRETKEIIERYKYFERDRIFQAGDDTVVTLFRRSVAIAGYTVSRKLAQKYSTDRFDGTLLYQLYLSGMILAESPAYYISDLIAIMRKDPDQKPTHFFGAAKAEKEKFNSEELDTNNSLNFVKGMIGIAKYLEDEPKKRSGILKRIMNDIGNYSYPLLTPQCRQPKIRFISYYIALAKLGLWKNLYFHVYFYALLLIGRRRCERLIIFAKRRLGRTPILGSLYTGAEVLPKENATP
tara:strand:- start:7741 stop:8859 length:1119 start_codon:yes stop_codon:yes gene_type:complete